MFLSKIFIIFVLFFCLAACKPRRSELTNTDHEIYPCQSLNTDNCNLSLSGRQVWQLSATIGDETSTKIYLILENKGGSLTWQKITVQDTPKGKLVQRIEGDLIHNSKFSIILKAQKSSCNKIYGLPDRERLYYYRIHRPNFSGNFETLTVLTEDQYDQFLDLTYSKQDAKVRTFARTMFLEINSYRKQSDLLTDLKSSTLGCFAGGSFYLKL